MSGEYNGLIPPQYPISDFAARNYGDKRNLPYGFGLLQPIALDLSVAEPFREIQFAGDVIYLDRRTDGEIFVKLDMAWPSGFPLAANSAMRGIPYKQIYLSWEAQSGKTAYLWCGYGVEIVPPNQDITAIGSITSPVDMRDLGFEYGTVFSSTVLLAANTPETIFAPASNTAGVRVFRAGFRSENVAGLASDLVLMHHTAAPVGIGTGPAIIGPTSMHSVAGVGQYEMFGELNQVMELPSARGLYYIANVAESFGRRSAYYTFL